MTTWLDAHIQVLSVAPVFGEELLPLIAPFAEDIAPGPARTSASIVSLLQSIGLLAGVPGAWRIAEPMRHHSLIRLQESHQALYGEIAAEVHHYASNGYGPAFKRVLGAQGARLSLQVLGIAAGTDDAFDQLIDVAEDGSRRGRHGDDVAAAHLLAELPPSDRRDREIDFFLGMAAWHSARETDALRHFRRVLLTDDVDRAAGIAAHLSGVASSRRGAVREAMSLLEHAVRTLRSIDDRRGLAVTLSSLGKCRRDFAEQLRARTDASTSVPSDEEDPEDLFERSVDELAEAQRLGQELEDAEVQGRALMELAVTYQRMGMLDEAIDSARSARSLLRQRLGADDVRSLVALGSIYRDAGDFLEAGQVLDQAVSLATHGRKASLELAIALNVLASNERRLNDSSSAARHAAASVELGRLLGNVRHLAHALHTLAVALIDIGGSERDFESAEAALNESDSLLARLHDDRGRSKLSGTRKYLRLRREG